MNDGARARLMVSASKIRVLREYKIVEGRVRDEGVDEEGAEISKVIVANVEGLERGR